MNSMKIKRKKSLEARCIKSNLIDFIKLSEIKRGSRSEDEVDEQVVVDVKTMCSSRSTWIAQG